MIARIGVKKCVCECVLDNVSMCVFVLEAVIVLLLCLVYIPVDCLCLLCLRICVCVLVFICVPLCVLVFMCVPLWFAYVCVYLAGDCCGGLRMLSATHWLLSSSFKSQFTSHSLLYLFFFVFCYFSVFVISFFLFFVMLANCALVCFLSLSKRLCHLLASKMGGHLDFKLLLHVVVLVQHLV